MNFDTITTDNIQSYFEYLENVKSSILEYEAINPTHLNCIVNEDPEFLKFKVDEPFILEKIFQRLLFLCEKILDKEYDINKYDIIISCYFLILKPKVPNNVMDTIKKHFRAFPGFWTNFMYQSNYYEYKPTIDEGRDSGSTVENKVIEASGEVS